MDLNVFYNILEKEYPFAKAELNYSTPYELLVATILSAQSTDKRVNIVTEKLFKYANTPEKMYSLGIDKIEELIKTIGLYKSKSKYLYNGAKKLIDEYNSIVPNTLEKLILLDGVGRKTANVVISNVFDTPAIAVDTHVRRLSNRLGFSNTLDVNVIEEDLKKLFPKERWTKLHHMLILHGRRVCKARAPLCDSCKIKEICPKIGVL